MKCPLLMLTTSSSEEAFRVFSFECFKEECAWWVKASKSCAMEAIPRVIGFLGSELRGIKDKMPHEGQFRK